jgi:hypothetical protein
MESYFEYSVFSIRGNVNSRVGCSDLAPRAEHPGPCRSRRSWMDESCGFFCPDVAVFRDITSVSIVTLCFGNTLLCISTGIAIPGI